MSAIEFYLKGIVDSLHLSYVCWFGGCITGKRMILLWRPRVRRSAVVVVHYCHFITERSYYEQRQ
mgnify:CR=1 FL=1